MAGVLLDVEPQDFVTSSSSASSAARAAASAGSRLRAALSGSTQMAGSDPAGLKWAAQYDQVAADAVRGLDSLETVLGQVSAGLAVTGLNYATADWLSAGHSGYAPGYSVPSLPGAVCSSPPPSSAGGSRKSSIPGFEYVANFIGEMWPDGDTGKLRAAKSAWGSFADDLDSIRSGDITRIKSGLDGNHAPELPTIDSTITSIGAAAGKLADEARNLATACGKLATEIDHVHQQTEQVLNSLVEQLAATAVVGIGLTIFTAGLSDGAAALAGGGEIAAAVARILGFIAELGTNVARVVDDIAVSAGSIAKVAGISEQITIRVVTIAGKSVVTGVGGAFTNVGVQEIVDPGTDIDAAAVQGFVGGAVFGGAVSGGRAVIDAANARREIVAMLGRYPRGSLKNIEVMEASVSMFDEAGAPIATRDLVHPRADLLDGEHPAQPLDVSGLAGNDPEVTGLLPKGFVRWNGDGEVAYAAKYTTGRFYDDGQPKIRNEAWPDGQLHPDGFQSPELRTPVVLKPGFQFDRFGPTGGRFVSPTGTEFPPRALSDYSLDAGYHRYEVLYETPAWAGPTAAAFGKSGGGPQLHTGVTLEQLLRDGFIKDITK